jgi:hypothetical protein
MKNLAYQLGANLFLEGNHVYSYETHVADIKNGYLEVFGKYSRTTGKHISKVASLFGLSVRKLSEEKQGFFQFQFGVKCQPPSGKRPLSQTTSIWILSKFGHWPTRENWFSAMANLPKIPAVDWAFICLHLDIDTKQKQPHACQPYFVTI